MVIINVAKDQEGHEVDEGRQVNAIEDCKDFTTSNISDEHLFCHGLCGVTRVMCVSCMLTNLRSTQLPHNRTLHRCSSHMGLI